MAAHAFVLLVATVLAAVVAAAWWRPRARVLTAAAAICVIAAVSVATGSRPWRAHVAEADVATRPIEVAADGYVSSSTCRACHPREHATWRASYHRSMTQRATPPAVLADWHGVQLSAQGRTWNLERVGDEYWIEMLDPVAVPGVTPGRVRRKVALTTGSHQMQVYWYESSYGRVLGMLPFSWQIAERRWITRLDSFVQPTDDPMLDGLGAWNLICTKCHVTHARPRLDMAADASQLHGADTEVGEFGIACEACHGPGEAHVQAHRNPAHRYAQRLASGPDPTIVDPRDLPHDRATMVCGQCHGQFDYQFTAASGNEWFRRGFRYRPGGDVLQDRKLKTGGDDQFWSDGEIRVAGREFNALAGSACYERGRMTCLSCHALHQEPDDPRPAAAWADDQLRADSGDRSCLQCHAAYGDDVVAHTHHRADSTGSRCMNCHMPHTTYGLMKGVRTHRIASPSVAATLATGRPNACNQCHLDQTLAWTGAHLQQWYGIAAPAVTGDAATFAAGVRWALEGNAAQRALVAWSLGWAPAREAAGEDWMVPMLAELLDDPYGAVRIIAGRSLATFAAFQDVRYEPRLDAAGRGQLKQDVLARWRARASTPGAARPAVLLGADGALQADEVRRLLARRDLRSIRLVE
ncbi:MAG TPA: C cytochrome precursor [Planctomycetota bacterium]|nr:C cytochrome precursor [Planctomycetota bacterium]